MSFVGSERQMERDTGIRENSVSKAQEAQAMIYGRDASSRQKLEGKMRVRLLRNVILSQA